jgi:hypothetical protein
MKETAEGAENSNSNLQLCLYLITKSKVTLRPLRNLCALGGQTPYTLNSCTYKYLTRHPKHPPFFENTKARILIIQFHIVSAIHQKILIH